MFENILIKFRNLDAHASFSESLFAHRRFRTRNAFLIYLLMSFDKNIDPNHLRSDRMIFCAYVKAFLRLLGMFSSLLSEIYF